MLDEEYDKDQHGKMCIENNTNMQQEEEKIDTNLASNRKLYAKMGERNRNLKQKR